MKAFKMSNTIEVNIDILDNDDLLAKAVHTYQILQHVTCV